MTAVNYSHVLTVRYAPVEYHLLGCSIEKIPLREGRVKILMDSELQKGMLQVKVQYAIMHSYHLGQANAPKSITTFSHITVWKQRIQRSAPPLTTRAHQSRAIPTKTRQKSCPREELNTRNQAFISQPAPVNPGQSTYHQRSITPLISESPPTSS